VTAVEQGLTYEAAWDFAERWVSRWNAHDVEGILALVSEDVIWDDPSMERTAHGHDASRRYIESLFRAFPDIAWTMPAGLYISPDRDEGTIKIAQPWSCRGTALGLIDPPGFAPTGHTFQLEGVDLWKLRPADGVLCQVASHYDALEFARRVDLMPARGSLAERMLVRLQRARERVRR
jgi:steroid delta-isomerase-like uncharacterized protein